MIPRLCLAAARARVGYNCPACGRWMTSFARTCTDCGGEGPLARRERLRAEGEALVMPLLRHFQGLNGDVEKTVRRMRHQDRGLRAHDRAAYRIKDAERKRRASLSAPTVSDALAE